MRLKLFLLLSILCLPQLTFAATYYVATTGSNGAAGSIGAPWATITFGVSQLQCGDTLYARGGTYTSEGYINFRKLCSASTPIKLLNYPGESPIIQYPTITYPTAPPSTRQIDFYGGSVTVPVSDVTISGFEIQNAYFAIHCEPCLRVTISNNIIHDSWQSAIIGNGYQVTITKNKIYHNGRFDWCATNSGTCNQDHGLYLTGTGYTITRNVIYDNLAYGIQMHAGAFAVGSFPDSNYAGFAGLVSNNTIAYERYRAGFVIWQDGGGWNAQIYNNILYENCQNNTTPLGANACAGDAGSGFDVSTGSAPTKTVTITKNYFYASGGGSTTFIAGGVAGTDYQLSGNSTSTDPQMVNTGATIPVSPDFSLTAGSGAIDFGTTSSGLSYNSTAPEAGAFEIVTHASCVVENGDASTIHVTFNNTVNPPIQITDHTGVTARKAGSNDVVTGVTVIGDNQLDIALTDAIINTDTVDWSYAQTGDLRDSANIGGTLTQEVLAQTNVSCTNNVGAAASHLFIQAKFEFHGLRGTEAAPVVLPYSAAAENTNINVVVGGKARLRLAITCTTADCPPTGFYLYYSKDGGAYAVVPDSFGADNIAFCGTGNDPDVPVSGTSTTDQLSAAGTLAGGSLVRTSNAIPTIDLDDSPATKAEMEYCVAWDSDATANATYDFRIYKQDTTAIDTYTVTPRATVRAISAGMGF